MLGFARRVVKLQAVKSLTQISWLVIDANDSIKKNLTIIFEGSNLEKKILSNLITLRGYTIKSKYYL